MTSALLLGLAGALYLAATIRYQKSMYSTDIGGDAWSRGRGFLWSAFVMHAASLIVWYFEAGHVPIHYLSETVAAMSWVMMGIYLVMVSWWNVEILGAFAAPLATLLILASLSTSSLGGPSSSGMQGGWMIGLHVAGIVIGYASFLLATVVAMLYYFQTLLLKRKSLTGVLQKMPSLENLDRVTYRLIAMGFPAIVIGMALGMARAQSAHTNLWSGDVVLGLITCAIYAAYIHARMVGGWHGRKVNRLLLVGFVFLVATYVGIGVMPWGPHQH